jgi:hypothetical protein
MGVGYIIGWNTSLMMGRRRIVGGIHYISAHRVQSVPSRQLRSIPVRSPINEMSPEQIWKNYIKYIGAGRCRDRRCHRPLSCDSLHLGFTLCFHQTVSSGNGATRRQNLRSPRTERDTPDLGPSAIGIVLLILFIWLVPDPSV